MTTSLRQLLRRLAVLLLLSAGCSSRAASAVAPAFAEERWHERPWPPWLRSYVVWHKAERNSPLVRRVQVNCVNSGLGDQVRGVMVALRFAAKHRLVLQVAFDAPLNVTHYWQPAALDWRPAVALTPNNSDAVTMQNVVHKDGFPHPDAEAFFRDLELTFHALGGRHLVLYQNAAAGYSHPALLQPLPDAEVEKRVVLACMFAALFAPTALLHNRTAAALLRLFPAGPPPRYTGVHLRLGGLVGEERELGRFGPGCSFLAVLAALDCARGLSRSRGIGAPAVFISDNAEVRMAASRGLLAGVVGPASPAAHIIKGRGKLANGVENVFVEILLLARATCLVAGASGFGDLALWSGGHVCFTDMHTCVANIKTMLPQDEGSWRTCN